MITPYKGKNKPESQKDANRAHARLRGPSERANAQLKTWHILRKLRSCPHRTGQLAKAIHPTELRDHRRMKRLIIEESLKGGALPPNFYGTRVKEYKHPLDEDTMVTIVELAVAERHALDAGMALARELLPRRYYAHLINDQSMYIAFPNCLVRLEQGDDEGEHQAQVIGQTFDIPLSQMRFLEMFEVDHPDAPARVSE